MTSQEFILSLRNKCSEFGILQFDSTNYKKRIQEPTPEVVVTGSIDETDYKKFSGNLPWWFVSGSVVSMKQWSI